MYYFIGFRTMSAEAAPENLPHDGQLEKARAMKAAR